MRWVLGWPSELRVDWVLQGGNSRGEVGGAEGGDEDAGGTSRAVDGHAGTVKREAAVKNRA